MLQTQHAKIALMGLSVMVIFGCSEKVSPDPRTQPPLVRVGHIETASEKSRTFTGTVAARVQSDLGFRVSGKVLERLVDAGQMVKAGQPLMRLDAKDLLLEVQARQESVAAAKAKADQAIEDEARNRDLVQEGAVSASNYDRFKAAADSAKAELNAAQAQAGVAKNTSGYALLVADADGVVMETLAEPGQVVAAGQIVVRIARAGKREAVVHLPETLRPSLGSVAQASLYGEEVSAAAKLRQLSSVADSAARTFEARYTLEGNLADAPLGATVSIRIPENLKVSNTTHQVPLGALYDAGNGTGLWLVKDKHVTWLPVKIQSLDDNFAHIEGNFKPGDQVVTLGANLLRQGEEVRVEGAAKANGAAVIGDAR